MALRRAIQVFGCGFAQGYGMTETTAGATFLMPKEHVRALAEKPELLLSCGRPLPGTEVRVVDAEDRDVPVGTVGEILLRGPQLMRGYWNLPEATAEALAGGWMHTGDAGRLDAEGFLYIQDRVKDMIVSGAENVYPREIENVLFEHPAVADAAVIGVPDARWGEVVKALVVLRPGARASEDELIEFCRPRLAGFKRPRRLERVEALPRTAATGQVQRALLVERITSGV
jgi:fatty-acyl-CoA synthase